MVVSSQAPRRANGTTPDTDRYRSILKAAREVFRSQGYNDATVEDLRRAAGVSRATFYFYFQDKREVIVRLLTETMGQFHELYRRKYPRTDEYTSIVITNTEYFAYYSRDSDLFLALRGVMDDPKVREIVEEVRRGFRRRVENKLSRLMAKGIIQPVDPEMLARLLIGMVETFVQQFFSLYRTEDEIRAHLADAVQLVSETWYRAVYLKEPPRPFPYQDLIDEADFRPLLSGAGPSA